MQQIRQGDVLLVRLEQTPEAFLKESERRVDRVQREHGRLVLAEGEATGHAHVIENPDAELVREDEELLGPGAANKDKTMEALVLVRRALPGEGDLLRDSLSNEALDALSKLVSEQFRAGRAPLGPREWGLFLEEVVWRAR